MFTLSNKNVQFPFQCWWLKFNGSWPMYDINSSFGKFYKVYSVFAIIVLSAVCAFQFLYMVFNFNDILKVTENCCTTFMGIHTCTRLVLMYLQRNEMKDLIDIFSEKIYVPSGTDDKIEKGTHLDILIYRVLSFFVFFLICLYCTIPIVEILLNSELEEKQFPYKMVFPYNAQETVAYIITYAYSVYAGYVALSTLFAEDSFFGFLVMHTCSRFQLLHKNINEMIYQENNSDLKKQNDRSLPKQIVQHEYNLKLERAIQEHNILIDFCGRLDTFCSQYLLLNFFISSGTICVVGFQIFTIRMTLANSSKFFVYIISALLQLFIICRSGDQLISNSLQTAEAFYACNWERYYGSTNNHPPDIKFLKNLVFAMLRAQKPLEITALKFSVLSLQSFSRILSTSMSYFTLLQTVYEKE